mgnify:CR=1 FL=1
MSDTKVAAKTIAAVDKAVAKFKDDVLDGIAEAEKSNAYSFKGNDGKEVSGRHPISPPQIEKVVRKAIDELNPNGLVAQVIEELTPKK